MSTQDWIAALGLYISHPLLLIATTMIVGFACCGTWWFQRQLLQSRFDAAAFKEQKAEAVLTDNEKLKRRVEALEQDETEANAQILQDEEDVLNDDGTRRVLVFLFNALVPEPDVDAMMIPLDMKRSVVQYHLDRLHDSRLAEQIKSTGTFGHTYYWTLTAEGRRLAVVRKVISDNSLSFSAS